MSRIATLVADTNDEETEDVTVDQWGGVTIRLKSMDLQHRGAYLERLLKARENEDDMALAQIQAELFVHCAFDPDDGTQAFNDSDIPMLLTKHGGVMGLLSTKASRLSGLDAEAEERLGKGFSGLKDTETPSVDSTST